MFQCNGNHAIDCPIDVRASYNDGLKLKLTSIKGKLASKQFQNPTARHVRHCEKIKLYLKSESWP